jgi:class 3 adenylate cyclase
VAVQRSLEALNTAGALPALLQARIGLGAGEPLTDGTALFGATVNLTARICAAAAPGQILAARVVRELCAGKSLAFRPHGEIELKGFPEPVELHAVEWSGAA